MTYMRVASSFLSMLALVLGFVQAPQLHMHEDGHNAIVHAHFSVHEEDHAEPGIEPADHDSNSHQINLMVACEPHAWVLLPAGTISEVIATLPVQWATIAAPCERAHDPPLLDSSHPRPPPYQAARALLNS